MAVIVKTSMVNQGCECGVDCKCDGCAKGESCSCSKKD